MGISEQSKALPTTAFGLREQDWHELLQSWGQPKFRVQQILHWLYQRDGERGKRIRGWSEAKNLPAALREKLTAELGEPYQLSLQREQGSADTTRKFLFRLHDGRFIEAVLIPANPALYGERSDRHTLCVSTQVGCAMACGFCASGLLGLTRNLDAAEIVEQVLAVEAKTGVRVDNLVFMGMGEPLANLKGLLPALEIFNAQVGIGARKMTVSTSGLAPQIRKLAEFPLQIRLALSLHGATDPVREQIMPVNQKWNIEAVMEALDYWAEHHKQRVSFEFILIEGVNDSEEQAYKLAQLAKKQRAKVNLIPYNTVEGLSWKRPAERVCERFAQIVQDQGVVATLRLEKGHDIDAACGQLRLKEEEKESSGSF